MDGIIAQDLAQNRLIHAGIATFGGDGSGFRQGATLDSVAELIANVPPPEIEGDSATFTIRIPPQLIALARAELSGYPGGVGVGAVARGAAGGEVAI